MPAKETRRGTPWEAYEGLLLLNERRVATSFVQQLRLHIASVEGTGSIPGWGTKIAGAK